MGNKYHTHLKDGHLHAVAIQIVIGTQQKRTNKRWSKDTAFEQSLWKKVANCGQRKEGRQLEGVRKIIAKKEQKKLRVRSAGKKVSE